MSVHASAAVDIAAAPRTILEFVLDLDRYRQADHKITRVTSVSGPDAEGDGSATMWGKMPGLPPARDRQDFHLDRWTRLVFTGAPRQPGRLVFDFVGTFDCDPIDDGSTRVTHAYEFRFRRPFRWVERRLAERIDREIEEELERLADLVAAE